MRVRSALFRTSAGRRGAKPPRRRLPRVRVRFRDVLRTRKQIPRPVSARRDDRGQRAGVLRRALGDAVTRDLVDAIEAVAGMPVDLAEGLADDLRAHVWSEDPRAIERLIAGLPPRWR